MSDTWPPKVGERVRLFHPWGPEVYVVAPGRNLIPYPTPKQELQPGDVITIQGVTTRKDGTLTKRCKPGNETPMVVSAAHKARRAR